MIAGPRPLSHLELIQVEIVESVEAHERFAFDEAAIDEVLGLLEAASSGSVGEDRWPGRPSAARLSFPVAAETGPA